MRWRTLIVLSLVALAACTGPRPKLAASVTVSPSTSPPSTASTSTAPPTTAPATTVGAPATTAVTVRHSPPTTARPPAAPAATARAGGATLHFTANEDGQYAQAAAQGYNVHDTGTDLGTIDSLPNGGKALVWLGEKCASGLSSSFTSAVDALGHDAHVLGYYLSDEPDPGACPQGPAKVAAESDYIHAHAPGQRSFVVVDDTPGAWAAYTPAHSHLDLVGLDPYPCRTDTGSCDYSLIDTAVNQAQAAGIPKSMLVPTFQDFGGATSWFMPSPAQLRTIVDRWAALLPSPPMDYSYSWGCQNGSLSDCLINHPDAQQIMSAHNHAG